MKNLLLLFFLFSFSKYAIMQDVPRCVNYLNSKMKSADEYMAALEEMKDQAGEFNFQHQYKGLSRDIENIKQNLEKECNQAKEPDYDFTEVKSQVDIVMKKYEAWEVFVNGAADAEERISKNTYKINQFFSYINNFPRMNINSSDQENYTAADTKELLSIEDIKTEYDEALSKINSSDIENSFYETIDERYSEYENYKDEFKLEYIQNHRVSVEFLSKYVFENNATLDRMSKYVDQLLQENASQKTEALSKVAVSDYHTNNVSVIRFTDNLSLDPAAATAVDFKTEFKAGEDIKAIAYLADTYLNIFGAQNDPQFEVVDDYTASDLAVENYKSGDEHKPYVEFYFSLPSSSYAPNPDVNPGTIRAMEYLSKLRPRTHKIELKLDSYMGMAKIVGAESDVRGTFTYDASYQPGLDKMRNELVQIKDKKLQNVQLPKAGMSNAGYESNCLLLIMVDTFQVINNLINSMIQL